MKTLQNKVGDVPAGIYKIGDDTYQLTSPLHRVEVPDYRISIATITNEIFESFIQDGAYEKPEFWSELGWRWRERKSVLEPAFWNDPVFNQVEQPVVGVSWYEAIAFANWLSHHTHTIWRLPTEIEWEIAARGTPSSPHLLNTLERQHRAPWDALNGNSNWTGSYNMLGNVWEWCSTRWGKNWQTLDYPYPYDRTDGREDLSDSYTRIIRGGSWYNPIQEATATFRARYLPGSRASNIGFRLVYTTSRKISDQRAGSK